MTPSNQPADRHDEAADAEPPAHASESEADPEGGSDVRSGGHAGDAPRSLTEAEARWQEHESSGASWDSGDTI